MKKILFLVIFCFVFFWPKTVSAAGEEIFNQAAEAFDFSDIDAQAAEIFDGEETLTFSSLFSSIISGEEDFSFHTIVSGGTQIFFQEIGDILSLSGKILLISVFGSLLTLPGSSFGRKSTAEIGFFVCYLTAAVLIFTSFQKDVALAEQTVARMKNTVLAMTPVFIAMTSSSGEIARASASGSVIGAFAVFFSNFVQWFLLPAVTTAASLSVLNRMTEKNILSNLTEIITFFVRGSLKAAAAIFMGILSLQRIGVSGLDAVTAKAAKTVVGAVPVIGDAMTGAAETALAVTGLIRNSAAAAAAVLLIAGAMVPVMKLAVAGFIYKLSAAFLQPISESRISSCLADMGNFVFLLVSIIFAAELVFIFAVLILLVKI